MSDRQDAAPVSVWVLLGVIGVGVGWSKPMGEAVSVCVRTCEHVWWCPCPPGTEGGAVAASGVVGHLDSPQPSEALAWALWKPPVLLFCREMTVL